MSTPLDQAQKAFEASQKAVNPRYKPRYHLSTPSGWLNDPNGFGFFQGKYHLFYQYNPYDSVWGNIHWGHWSTEDLVDWHQEPVAMAPDHPSDALGCFSGSAMEENGVYHLMYTGICEETPGGMILQQQCLAHTKDGVHVEKYEHNPVVGAALLPDGASPYDFRDPKLEKTDRGYRLLLASRGEYGGQMLSYLSGDLKSWRYDCIYMDGLARMAECPDGFWMDGRRVAIVCLMKEGEDRRVIYRIGHEENGRFCAHTPMIDIDYGLDFYAPQTCLAPDGRRLMIAWAFCSGRVSPAHTLGHGWAGTMTLPRECTLHGDRLYLAPIRELRNLRKAEYAAESMEITGKVSLSACAGRCKEIVMDADLSSAGAFSLRLMETGDEHLLLRYDKHTETLTIDRAHAGYPPTADFGPEEYTDASARVSLREGRLHLHIFIDVSIAEVFVNYGEIAMSCQAFPKGESYGVSAEADGCVRLTALESYDIG